MENNLSHTLPKRERLCSRKALEELFNGGHKSVASFPLRAVYMPTQETETRILVSVSKRFFKRAVKRNRIKRQLREAYRLNKHLLRLPEGMSMDIAFLWNSNELLPSNVVSQKMQNLLQRIHESVTAPSQGN